jgi:hypothetical protein
MTNKWHTTTVRELCRPLLQNLLRLLLRVFIENFVVVYFEDILIYSKSFDDHIKHLRVIFYTLRNAHLFDNIEKCTFYTDISFLGYIGTTQGIYVDKVKIVAITSWPIPTTITQVRSFLGIVGFDRYFIRDFSTIAAPLHE